MNAPLTPAPGAAALPPRMSMAARDGETLYFRQYSDGHAVDLILLADIGQAGASLHALAERLRDHANVFVPDLRGHSTEASTFAVPQRRRSGDIDYARQLEDDLVDLCLELRRHDASPRPVALLGVGTGGALALRFACGQHQRLIAGSLLLCPRFINLPWLAHFSSAQVRRWLTVPLWLLGPVGQPLQHGLWAMKTQEGFTCTYAMMKAFQVPRFMDTDLSVLCLGQSEGRPPLSLPAERRNVPAERLLSSEGTLLRTLTWLNTLTPASTQAAEH